MFAKVRQRGPGHADLPVGPDGGGAQEGWARAEEQHEPQQQRHQQGQVILASDWSTHDNTEL